MADNKVALITGASRGIGKACALELAKSGYDIAITYAGNDEAANKTISELECSGVKAKAYKFDVADFQACNNAVEEILKEFTKVDVLVNNAGITRDGLFMRMSSDNWNAVINTNLSSAFNMTNPLVRSMIKRRSGCIINMSSIVGVMGNAGQANYSAAKAGLIGFTKSLAKELGARNIRVNAVAPGFIATDMTKDLSNTEEMLKFIPLKRMGTPDDIATAVKFLAVDSNYVTGQVLEVDGGMII